MGENNTIVSACIGTYNSIALTHRYIVQSDRSSIVFIILLPNNFVYAGISSKVPVAYLVA